MERRLTESMIIRELAESVCQRVARATIRALQEMTDCRLSGDDSGLQNAWDEICVQIQHERSVFWSAYEQTVESLVKGHVDQLPGHECDAVWLQTPQGRDWAYSDEDRRDANPVCLGDVVSYVAEEFVYAEADRWSNPRIRKYLDEDRSTD